MPIFQVRSISAMPSQCSPLVATLAFVGRPLWRGDLTDAKVNRAANLVPEAVKVLSGKPIVENTSTKYVVVEVSRSVSPSLCDLGFKTGVPA